MSGHPPGQRRAPGRPARAGVLPRGRNRQVLSAQGAELRQAYEVCRRLNAAHGKTYYFATRFLPADVRHHVHALYGFARHTDELVDGMDAGWGLEQRRAALEAWSGQLLQALDGGSTADPVLTAVRHTVRQLGIDNRDLRAFLASMAMDLTVTRYATYGDLRGYMHGSAAVIGSMLLPLLRPTHPEARDRAMDLGVAFQLTNFLRDVAEDWDRGRIYLPLEDLDRFGVTEWEFRSRSCSPGMRRLLAFEATRARALYRRAEQGWTMVHPRSQTCIRIAHRLYGEILDRLERADWQVWQVRARVPPIRKVAVAAQELTRASRARPEPEGDRPARRVSG